MLLQQRNIRTTKYIPSENSAALKAHYIHLNNPALLREIRHKVGNFNSKGEENLIQGYTLGKILAVALTHRLHYLDIWSKVPCSRKAKKPDINPHRLNLALSISADVHGAEQSSSSSSRSIATPLLMISSSFQVHSSSCEVTCWADLTQKVGSRPKKSGGGTTLHH